MKPILNNSWMARIGRAITASILVSPTTDSIGATMDSMNAVVKGNTTFAINLHQIERAKPGNLFFSPYSISTALAMMYGGARGDTAQEIARVFHFDAPQADLPQTFSDLAHRFDEIAAGTNVQLHVANSLWYQRDYHVTEAFMKLSRDAYHADVESVDFVGNSAAACASVNAWVAHTTQDKIRELLEPGQLSPLTRVVLCNAIYFKGTWAAQFNPRATRPAPFFITPQQSIATPMMSQTLRLRDRSLEDVDIFALPYKGNEVSMIILLPKAKDGLAAVERQFDDGKLADGLAALDATPMVKADLTLPKFKLDLRLELTSALKEMGMRSAFDPAQADFSGITGRRDLSISSVVHQAYVDVNEEGTEAAAATAVVARTSAVMREETIVLHADHPFLFLIRENQTGTILFLGRMVNPSK